MDFKKIKEYCLVAAFAIVFYLTLNNLKVLLNMLLAATALLTPFFIGIVLAFLLSGVMRRFERQVFAGLAHSPRKRVRGLVRPLSLLATYILLFCVLALAVSVILPQLITSVSTLVENVQPFLDRLVLWVEKYADQMDFNDEVWQQISVWLESAVKSLLDFVPELLGLLPAFFSVAVSVGGGVFTGVMGLILSIYMLLDKERILSQLARIVRAIFPAKIALRIEHTSLITVRTFEKYVGGQLLDALIVGTVSVIGLLVLGFPYAMLVGVVMGITNIIPFFGPFLGAIPGFFIIAMVDPIKALWYILFVVVLQQIDGNLLVPRIIGDSVGLPPLWVLFSVIVGGGMFGIAGMILGTPLFAVVYQLVGRAVRAHEHRTLPPEKAIDTDIL